MSIRFLSEANADVGEALAWLVGRRRYRGVTDLWEVQVPDVPAGERPVGAATAG